MKFTGATVLVVVASLAGCHRQEPKPASATATQDQREVAAVDPHDILFTTPTLNDGIPKGIKGSVVPPDCIQMHEDDWRQFELIPASLKPEVDAELAEISAIWDQHSVKVGDSGTAFRQVHLRKRIPQALNIPMSLAEFESLVGHRAIPMTFFGYGAILRDVHAFKVDNLLIYADIQDGILITVGFDAVDQFLLPADFAKRLSELIRTHDLMLSTGAAAHFSSHPTKL